MQANDTPAEAIDSKEQKASWRERADSELEKIVQLFSSKQLPDLCSRVLIAAPQKPSSNWSMGNQLLMLLAGTSDARGYRQWQDVGRHVRLGSKAFYILGPVFVQKPVDGEAGEEETVDVLVGFRTIPVFRLEDTEGADLPTYTPRDPPPLLDVAERFGMRINYIRLSAGVYGYTDYEKKVVGLATESWDVFWARHESLRC